MIKKLLIFTIIFILSISSFTFVYAKNGYTIEAYDVNIVVNENNTFDITETIRANFEIPKHGIYRKIPLKNEVLRTDGTTSKNNVNITNVSVDATCGTANENGYRILKIGDSGITLTGPKTYTIKYNYDIGKDPVKDADEFYFNIIGTEWDTSINNVTFKVIMPKEFDATKLGFASGRRGSTGSSKVTYNVDGNVITGSLNGILMPGEGLTIRLTLPDGYFVGANSNIFYWLDTYVMIVIGACTLCILIAFIIWKKYGKDDPVVETVEFYPPKGYNSAEVGFMYKGYAETKDVISLLIYLADKGYIKIEEYEQKGVSSKKKSFRIVKLKEYDGNNPSEQKFFSGLFKRSNIPDVDDKTYVTPHDLIDKFYRTINSIGIELGSKEYIEQIFEKTANNAKRAVFAMMWLINIGITAKPMLEFNIKDTVLVLAETILMSSASLITDISFFGLLGCIIPFFFSFEFIVSNPSYMVGYIIGVIAIIILSVFVKIMRKRTTFGNEMLGKIRGFKRFLETAEKQQLESLVNENPEYFYNILPYTYALGVSDVWMKQFETIAIKSPDWYECNGAFVMHDFGTFMNSTMREATSAMTSSPSSSGSGGSYGGGSSGGGSSGGGSSGGGSGGGGGSSW